MEIDLQDRHSHVVPWPPTDLEQLGEKIAELGIAGPTPAIGTT